MDDEYDEEYSYEEIEEWAEEYESDDGVPVVSAAAGRTTAPTTRSRLAPSQKAPRQAFGTPPPGAKASPARTPGAGRPGSATKARAAAGSPYGDRSSPASRSTPVNRQQQSQARRVGGSRAEHSHAASPQSSAVTQGDLIAIYRKANAELKKQMYNNSNTQYVTQLENEIKTKDMSLAKLAEEVRTLKQVQRQQEKALKQDQAVRKERSASDAYEADLRVLREKLKRSQDRRQEEREVMRGLQAQVEKLEARTVRKPVSKAAEATDRKRSSADKALRQQEEQIAELERKVRILTTAKSTEARRFEHDIAELKREGAKLHSEIELLKDHIKEKDTIIRRNQIQMREMEKRQKEHKVRATDRSRANRVLKSQLSASKPRASAAEADTSSPAVQLDFGSERKKDAKPAKVAKAAKDASTPTKTTPVKASSSKPAASSPAKSPAAARASIASPTRQRSRSRPTPVDVSSASNASRAERQQFSPSGPSVVDHEGRSAIASRGQVASPHVYGRSGRRTSSPSPVRDEDEDEEDNVARAAADGQEQRRRRLEAAGPAPTVPLASRGGASDSDASDSDEEALLRNESRGGSQSAARPTTSKASARRIRVAEDPDVLEAESVRTSSSRGSSRSRTSRPNSAEQGLVRPTTSAARARSHAPAAPELDDELSSSIEEDIELDAAVASARPMTSHSRTMSRQASTRGSGRPVTRKSERSMTSGMDSEATQLVAEDFEGQPARGANAASDDEDALLRDERRR